MTFYVRLIQRWRSGPPCWQRNETIELKVPETFCTVLGVNVCVRACASVCLHNPELIIFTAFVIIAELDKHCIDGFIQNNTVQ